MFKGAVSTLVLYVLTLFPWTSSAQTPSIVPFWTYKMPGNLHEPAGVTIADLDGDQENGLELLVGDHVDPILYIFHSDGSAFQPWPINLGFSVIAQPTVADIDGIPENGAEIVVGLSTKSYPGRESTAGIAALHYDGTFVPGWPHPARGLVSTSPAVANLDGTGIKIVAGDFNYEAPGKIYVMNADGSDMSGWPKNVREPSLMDPAYRTAMETAALADLGGGQGLSILAGTNFFAPPPPWFCKRWLFYSRLAEETGVLWDSRGGRYRRRRLE